ncbi:hypothetical protein LIER_12004 [Lithospermum erythrorhizon]|uniref:BTB/POZ domain-containing protein TNFAIP1 n=1 Tax=Lithospermum erythrorhizon TaxID=34254 RepID=A0AAV3PRJ8_LITER
MALSITSSNSFFNTNPYPNPSIIYPQQFTLSFPCTTKKPNPFTCKASSSPNSAKSSSGSVKKHQNSNTKKKKNPNKINNNNGKKMNPNNKSKGAIFEVEVEDDDDDDFEVVDEGVERYQPLPLPKPPAGFILDGQGRVLTASSRRITTIVDSANNLPLDCIIRRIFRSSDGDECMLLCPVDTPVQILKSVNNEGWSAVGDEEVEAILPTAAYALAKIHMHLVYSGFCYTARGGFCYTEDDIFDFRTDDGEDVDGLPTEGVEITCFHMDGSHYMIYTPSDPLLFVAVKDENDLLQIADDELLEDPAIISAIDEETEFNALVEEEAALLESLLGKR